MTKKPTISDVDIQHYEIIRSDVSRFLKHAAQKYDKKARLLDIAPQVHEGAKPYFKKATISTLDINASTKPTYVLDICNNNSTIIPDNFFTFIVCTEVLEHVRNPFAAVEELYRILQDDGLLFLSTPFNFRIHGPLPDCWRFTEHGLRQILSKFRLVNLQQVETKSRWLMPVHYTVIAKK